MTAVCILLHLQSGDNSDKPGKKELGNNSCINLVASRLFRKLAGEMSFYFYFLKECLLTSLWKSKQDP